MRRSAAIVTADSTAYTADNSTWPTADGGRLVAVGGGGRFRLPPQPVYPVEGRGYGVLPELEGEAHGVVVPVAGAAVARVSGLVSEANGIVCVGGDGAAELPLCAVAIGDRGAAGEVVAVLAQFAGTGTAGTGVQGAGAGMLTKFNGAALGQHVDEEAAVVVLLLAA